MKKFIFQLFAFFLFSSLIYIIGVGILGSIFPKGEVSNIIYKKGFNGHLYSRINEIAKYDEVDILFLGSSHAYRGFDTRIFKAEGYSSFNLGSSAQTPLQTYTLVSKYLEDLEPKIVIFEVYPGTFVSDGVESSLDLIANDEITSETIDMVLATNHIKTYNSLIVGMFDRLFIDLGIKEIYEENHIKGKDLYVSGGFVERNKEKTSKVVSNLEGGDWKYRKQNLNYFEKILEKLEEKGLRIYLVFAPITKERLSKIENKKEIDQLMIEYENKFKKTKYIDFSSLNFLKDDQDFYDLHHLNQNGVIKFNKFFIQKLKSDLFLVN